MSLLTLREAAGKLRVSVRTIEREILDRKLSVTFHGARRYINEAEIDAYIAAGGSCRPSHPQADYSDRMTGLTSRIAIYNGPAVYFLYERKELVYIGQAARLLNRLLDHIDRKPFDSFSYIACGIDEISPIENWAIRKFKPKLNRALVLRKP